MTEFTRKVKVQTLDRFPPKSDVMDILSSVMKQNLRGEFVIVLPGNGGIRAIEFRGSEQVHEADGLAALQIKLDE